MGYFKSCFSFQGRWSRLQFWLYPIPFTIVPIIGALVLISFISLEGYKIDAKNANINVTIMNLTTAIEIDSMKSGRDVSEYVIPSSKYPTNSETHIIGTLNFSNLNVIESDFQHPYDGEQYLIGVDTETNLFQLFGLFRGHAEEQNVALVKGSYYQNDSSDLKSLIFIDNKYITDGENMGIAEGSGEINHWTYIVLIFLFAILSYYIKLATYVKRLRDLGSSPWLVLLTFIPFVSLGLLIYCGFFKGTSSIVKFGEDSLRYEL